MTHFRDNRINPDAEIETALLTSQGNFPNNDQFPAIIYRQVIRVSGNGSPAALEEIFSRNGWGGSWRNGIYSFHNYHSTTQEVLGIYSGTAGVQLGGTVGRKINLEMGDVVLLPAGVAHKNQGTSPDFGVVGAYPGGRSRDMNYGREGERPGTDESIRNVPDPDRDPVFGENGSLETFWNK